IVAIHGLDGHREASFTADNGILWLRDLLPEALPSARILTYGYDACTHGPNRSQQPLFSTGTNVRGSNHFTIIFFRNDVIQDRPLIFIAHSFGGIILKNALIHASSAHTRHLPNHQTVGTLTYGVIFMGTPHQGIDLLEWAKSRLDGRSLESLQDDPLLRPLAYHSEVLQQQLTQYNPIGSRFKTVFCYELYTTGGLMGNKHVPASSGVVPGAVDAESIGVYKTHIDMVKFPSKEDGDYNNIVFQLQKMVAGVLEGRQVSQGETRNNIDEHVRLFAHLMDSTPLAHSNDTVFGRSKRSRPVTYHIGRHPLWECRGSLVAMECQTLRSEEGY
ncbi:hypothetical protein BU17DRAFT_40873, partial [Hysterangium stoloniferum]